MGLTAVPRWIVIAVGALIVMALALGVRAASQSWDSNKQAYIDEENASPSPIDTSAAVEDKASYLATKSPESTDQPGESPLTGIMDVRSGPFSPDDYTIQNGWQNLVDGTLTQVWAGAATEDGSIGLLIVREMPWPPASEAEFDVYQAPGGSGSLKILAVNGSELTLSSESGQSFLFDLESRTFVSEPTPSST